MLPFILACLSSIGKELDKGDLRYESLGMENPRGAVGGGYGSVSDGNGSGSLNKSNEIFGLPANFSQQDMIKYLQRDFKKDSLLSSSKQELNGFLASLNNSEELQDHLESLKSSANDEVNRYLSLFNQSVTDFSGEAVGTSNEVRISFSKR